MEFLFSVTRFLRDRDDKLCFCSDPRQNISSCSLKNRDQSLLKLRPTSEQYFDLKYFPLVRENLVMFFFISKENLSMWICHESYLERSNSRTCKKGKQTLIRGCLVTRACLTGWPVLRLIPLKIISHDCKGVLLKTVNSWWSDVDINLTGPLKPVFTPSQASEYDFTSKLRKKIIPVYTEKASSGWKCFSVDFEWLQSPLPPHPTPTWTVLTLSRFDGQLSKTSPNIKVRLTTFHSTCNLQYYIKYFAGSQVGLFQM